MGTKVKIVCSPFTPNLEVAEGLVLAIHAPYSDTSVAIQVNPAVDGYQESADQHGVSVRQVMVTHSTDETQTLSFDLQNNSQLSITVNNQQYSITLQEIGKDNIQGQDFLFFLFDVERF